MRTQVIALSVLLDNLVMARESGHLFSSSIPLALP